MPDDGPPAPLYLSSDDLRQRLDAFAGEFLDGRSPETVGTYRRALREYERFAATRRAAGAPVAFDAVGAEDYRHHLVSVRGLSQVSISTYLTALRRFGQYLVAAGLIEENPAMVQALVDYVLGAGQWLDAAQENRDKAAEIAAGLDYFNQDPEIIKYVMQNPADRVTYGDLRMIRSEFEELMELSMQAGTLGQAVPYEKYMDESFAQVARPTPIEVLS